MGYAKVSDRRKLYAYNLGMAGTSYRTIQKLDQRRFGNQNTEMALGREQRSPTRRSAITAARRAARLPSATSFTAQAAAWSACWRR